MQLIPMQFEECLDGGYLLTADSATLDAVLAAISFPNAVPPSLLAVLAA